MKYGKIYDNFEDRFRKTVYCIRKATIENRNQLFAHGLSSYGQAIDSFTDGFDDEIPSAYYEPAAIADGEVVAAPAVHGRALVAAAPEYSYAHPFAHVRSAYPLLHQRAFFI